MKKDGIQTRKRKPKNPAKEGAKKTLSSSYSYLKQQNDLQQQQQQHVGDLAVADQQVYQRPGKHTAFFLAETHMVR